MYQRARTALHEHIFCGIQPLRRIVSSGSGIDGGIEKAHGHSVRFTGQQDFCGIGTADSPAKMKLADKGAHPVADLHTAF